MIAVSKESWHARFYLWWYYAKYGYSGVKTNSNLCPYVRTVLVWAPFRWWFRQGKILGFHVAWVTWPLLALSIPQPLGFFSYRLKIAMWIMVGILFLGALGSSLIMGITFLIIASNDRWRWVAPVQVWLIQKFRHLRWKKDYYEYPEKKKGPTFWSLMGARIRAGHDRICPELEFKKPEDL
jgi:hypothetical protein